MTDADRLNIETDLTIALADALADNRAPATIAMLRSPAALALVRELQAADPRKDCRILSRCPASVQRAARVIAEHVLGVRYMAGGGHGVVEAAALMRRIPFPIELQARSPELLPWGASESSSSSSG